MVVTTVDGKRIIMVYVLGRPAQHSPLTPSARTVGGMLWYSIGTLPSVERGVDSMYCSVHGSVRSPCPECEVEDSFFGGFAKGLMVGALIGTVVGIIVAHLVLT